MIRTKQIRKIAISTVIFSLILNLYFWTGTFAPSYALSNVFEQTFWVLAPCMTLIAYAYLDSGSYLPSLHPLRLPWQLAYLIEKLLHLTCCGITISSFLLLLSAFLISGAPTEYRTVRIGKLAQSRTISYRYYWQIQTYDQELSTKDLEINRNIYKFLSDHQNHNITIRLRQNLAGVSVTVLPQHQNN